MLWGVVRKAEIVKFALYSSEIAQECVVLSLILSKSAFLSAFLLIIERSVTHYRNTEECLSAQTLCVVNTTGVL